MDKVALHNLFQLTPKSDAPEFVIYSSKLSERLGYTCKFIFENVLNCRYVITDNKQQFKNSSAFKISYSSNIEKDVFNISPYELLFKTTIDLGYTPKGVLKNGNIFFHANDSSCSLGHDIFSSVFYFISCYQEWQPFEADVHGRFELQKSIQYKQQQHLRPIVNIWIEELKQSLIKKNPSINFPEKKFQYISTIDVDNLYAYKSKGTARTIGAIAKDIFTFKFSNLNRRLKVINGKLKDPFDVYDELNNLSKKTKNPLFYFFLQRTGTEYDRTINPMLPVFKNIFDKLKKGEVGYGLHPSYETVSSADLLKKEFELIRTNSNSAIQISRQHYLRFNIKTTPKQLIHNDVIADFTMGFASGAGYRAGTFTPFYYYDFETEKATDLLMVPFAVMDGVFFNYSSTSVEDAEKQIFELAEEAKRLSGIFVSVFHERTFDEVLYPGFGELYRKLNAHL